MSITTTFRHTHLITLDEIGEIFPKNGKFNTELNGMRERIKQLEEKLNEYLDVPLCRKLEEENKRLWSEQHEAQRVYRRLLAELGEQRVINEELRKTRGDV